MSQNCVFCRHPSQTTHVLHQIFERDDQFVRFRVLVQAVIVVVDGDKAHPEDGKNLFDIISRLQMVAPEPGQIFDDDTVDLAGFYM